jgi:hypothetical protein
MRTFALQTGVSRVASGVVFTDGRAVVVRRHGGRTELHPSLDSVMRDYLGTAGLVWDKGADVQDDPPRLFVFHRHVDGTGFSGEGVAMEGAQFTDRVVLTWLGPYRSLVEWPDIEQAVTVHGHGGNTRLAWLDGLYHAV